MAISAKQMNLRLSSIANLQWLQNQVQEIVIKDNQELRKEKIDEFKHGLRPDGRIIGLYHSKAYEAFKQTLNPLAGGKVDLILSQSFSNSMFVKPFNKGYIFDASDSKTDKLKGKYGLDIMGLNQEYFNERQKTVYKSILIGQISNILNK